MMGITAQTENYNFLSVSYDDARFSFGNNSLNDLDLKEVGVVRGKTSHNSFGIQYNYGLRVGDKPVNVKSVLNEKWVVKVSRSHKTMETPSIQLR